METREIKTTFFLSEFDEEEKWLGVQHTQGWKLAAITGSRYVFEPCPKEEWIYQLDFRGKRVRLDEYRQLFADLGWEYVLRHGRWFYFRKKKQEGDADTSIFSDRESKIAMCERVIRGQLAARVAVFAVGCAIVALTVFTDVFASGTGFLSGALPFVGMGLMIAASFSFQQYRKLKRKIEALRNPFG